VAQECIETKDGLTIWEDHFYPEIIDPDSGIPRSDGEAGELVFTTLTKEGMPLIRYRTRDLTRLLPGTARTMRRMERVKGRSDDMLIIRGVNVFPSQIEAALSGEEGLAPHYVLELRRAGPLDELDIVVETRQPLREATGEREALRLRAEHLIKAQVGVTRGADRRPWFDRTLARQGQARARSKAKRLTRPKKKRSKDRSGVGYVSSWAGLPAEILKTWQAAEPDSVDDFADDCRRYAAYWQLGRELLDSCRPRPLANDEQTRAAEAIHERARAARQRFLARHVASVYSAAHEGPSRSLFVSKRWSRPRQKPFRVLCPRPRRSPQTPAGCQRDKEGVEIDQGIFLSHVLGDERSGTHLCHAMLLPREDTAAHLEKFYCRWLADLGAVTIQRHGHAVHVTLKNPRYLNAEDQTRSMRRRSASIWRHSTPKAASPCSGAGRSNTSNTVDAAYSQRHQSHASLPWEEFPFSGSSSASLVSCINSCVAWRAPIRFPTTFMVWASKSPGSPWSKALHRRPLPDSADAGLRAGGQRRLHDVAGAKRGHRARCC